MKLQFNGVADFINRRISLFHELDGLTHELESKLGKLESFSPTNLGEVSNYYALVRYFLLKDLIAENQSFKYGNQDSQHRGKVEVERDNGGFKLEVRARRPDRERALDFLTAAYDSLPDGNQAWLIGRNIDNSSLPNGDEDRYDNPFNTLEIIKSKGLEGSLVLVGHDEKGPRQGWDRDGYQRFRSQDGFKPVADFCREFSYQFDEAIIVVPNGTLCLEPERRRQQGWDVTHYSAKVDLKSSGRKEFVDIGELVDRYLVAA